MDEGNDEGADLEQLRQQTQKGTKTESVAKVTDETDDDQDPLTDRIIGELDAIDSGDSHKTLSYRDTSIKALFAALTDDELERVIDGLAAETDRDPEDYSPSEAYRLAMRVGLQNAVPEFLDDTRDAVAKNATQNV